jgi:hypothetical protein
VLQFILATIIDIPKKWTSQMYIICLLHKGVLENRIISLEIEVSNCRSCGMNSIRKVLGVLQGI